MTNQEKPTKCDGELHTKETPELEKSVAADLQRADGDLADLINENEVPSG